MARIDDIARAAAETLIDRGCLPSHEMAAIIAAAIREALGALHGVAMNMPPARTVFRDGSRHSPEFYAGHKAARHQIAEAISAAFGETKEAPDEND